MSHARTCLALAAILAAMAWMVAAGCADAPARTSPTLYLLPKDMVISAPRAGDYRLAYTTEELLVTPILPDGRVEPTARFPQPYRPVRADEIDPDPQPIYKEDF